MRLFLLESAGRARLRVQLPQDLVEVGFALEPDAGSVVELDAAVLHHRVVGEAAGGLELAWVGLVATELEGGSDVQRELVPTVRDAAARGPTMLGEHVLDAAVLDQAVAQGRVDLDVVAIGAHAAVADQVPGVLEGEEILAGGDGTAVVLRERRVEVEVQRVADLLIPEQAVRIDGPAVLEGGLEVEAAVDIDRKPGAVTV